MEKIFDAILKLVPINLLFEYFGISPETSADLSLIITAVLFFLLGWLLKRLQVNITNSKGAKDLAPYFDAFKVKQSRLSRQEDRIILRLLRMNLNLAIDS